MDDTFSFLIAGMLFSKTRVGKLIVVILLVGGLFVKSSGL